MASAANVRRHLAEVSRRLLALLEESVTPANAVQILVAEKILPPQAGSASEFPLSSAISAIIPSSGNLPNSAEHVASFVHDCETRGRGKSALRLIGRQKIKRAQGRVSLGLIGIELILLVIVLTIHSIFVLPQFKAMFEAANTPMPAVTQLVYALIGPSGPFIYVGIFVLLALVIWRVFPFLFGPLLRPIDRLLLTLPLVGSAIRQSNSDRISGWLGFAAANSSSQKAAIEAAKDWYMGDILARECAAILHSAHLGQDISTLLECAPGFDSAFRAALRISDSEDSLAAMRARWRIADTLPEHQSAIAPALAQIAIGVVVAAVVIAMYSPIFKLGALVGN
ncbi:hypothetical protein [Dokdonella sp.]|uniref:hypothetical protein n=1 Tax=Dokdonella sp. TaxID=2291710 RepID=UPI003528BDE8